LSTSKGGGILSIQKALRSWAQGNHPTKGKRARKLVRHLVEDSFTIVSGLAKGIDTVVHKTTIDARRPDYPRDRHSP
jgi:hypothetical protein